MSKYDLESIPVVTLQNKLVGRITIDDIVDVIQELADHEKQLMAGISENVDYVDNIWHLTRARLPWLVVGLIGGLVGAQLIGVFEDVLDKVKAIAFFIPLIMATGGNVGIQSSSIMVQSLANKTLTKGVGKEMMKSFLVSILNGIALASLVFLFTYLFNHDPYLSLVVSVSLMFVVVLASLSGTITPIILDRFNVNPAVASGPFITTANDILGIVVYFYCADYILGLH
jgi:magnesium transporter